jgi:hypothetical protein
MSDLGTWTAAACRELGVDPADIDVRQVLGVARDVARAVERPAAPVSAYLLGLAAGRGADPRAAAAALTALAASWPSDADTRPAG